MSDTGILGEHVFTPVEGRQAPPGIVSAQAEEKTTGTRHLSVQESDPLMGGNFSVSAESITLCDYIRLFPGGISMFLQSSELFPMCHGLDFQLDHGDIVQRRKGTMRPLSVASLRLPVSVSAVSWDYHQSPWAPMWSS